MPFIRFWNYSMGVVVVILVFAFVKIYQLWNPSECINDE